MKRILSICLVFIICITSLLSSCKKNGEASETTGSGTTSDEMTSSGSDTAETEKGESTSSDEEESNNSDSETMPGDNEPYNPTEEEIAAYADTWKYSNKIGGKEIIFRMILDSGGMAQLVVQSGIGNVIDLSIGKWCVIGKNRIKLDMKTVTEDGEAVNESKQKKNRRGIYGSC